MSGKSSKKARKDKLATVRPTGEIQAEYNQTLAQMGQHIVNMNSAQAAVTALQEKVIALNNEYREAAKLEAEKKAKQVTQQEATDASSNTANA